MNYHDITYPDMNNGDGLRVTLWLSGCSHHCYNCQNPQTWNPDSGILFDKSAEEELFGELSKDYISGLTLTGGDPLHKNNIDEVLNLVNKIRLLFGNSKTIWLYTGSEWFDIFNGGMCFFTSDPDYIRREIIKKCDVLVDGRYIDSQRDITLKWRGSSNQRVINVQKSLQKGELVLWET